ncbi:MAG: 23S rRNA (adenine(1618)-N(6))-methyltransferase RlmF [Rikenellaceae bacterium]
MTLKRQNKGELHPRNRHRDGYDFDALIEAYPPLAAFVELNKYGTRSINFFDSTAVKRLNAALLKLHYQIEWWDIPPSALTPPIPGRADYIHYTADLIGSVSAVRCLDIGVGANCIYPIIGRAEYGWDFVGSDIEESSLESARRIIESNALLRDRVEVRLQSDRKHIFEGVIKPGDRFDVTICNPPFHDSEQSAKRGTQRKLRGLKASTKGVLNFGGASNELWCEGGERRFVEQMILESRAFAKECRWFTTLISNEDNLKPLSAILRRVGVAEQRIVEMHQGNKKSRILAWRY